MPHIPNQLQEGACRQENASENKSMCNTLIRHLRVLLRQPIQPPLFGPILFLNSNISKINIGNFICIYCEIKNENSNLISDLTRFRKPPGDWTIMVAANSSSKSSTSLPQKGSITQISIPSLNTLMHTQLQHLDICLFTYNA